MIIESSIQRIEETLDKLHYGGLRGKGIIHLQERFRGDR